MNKIRVYEYKSNPPYTNDIKYAGKDLTNYVSYGATFENVIDETLPTYTLSLKSTDNPNEYPPLFKFIVQLVDYQYNSDTETAIERVVKQFDCCVRQDMVETVIMSDGETTYNHHLTLSSLALIAQRKKCDDLAITYELADVSLDYAPSFDPTEKKDKPTAAIMSELYNYSNKWRTDSGWWIFHVYHWHYQIETKNQFFWRWKNPTDELEWANYYYNQQANMGESTKLIDLPLPLLIMKDAGNNEVCMRYRVVVERTLPSEPNNWKYFAWNGGTGAGVGQGGNEYVRGRADIPGENWDASNMNYSAEVGSALHQVKIDEGAWNGNTGTTYTKERIATSQTEYISYVAANKSRCVFSGARPLNSFFYPQANDGFGNLVYTATQINDGNRVDSPRRLTFNADIDYLYRIRLVFEPFSENTNNKYYQYPAYSTYFYGEGSSAGGGSTVMSYFFSPKENSRSEINSTLLSMSLNIQVWSADPLPIPYTQSGVQYSVYEMINKAIDTAETYLVDNDADFLTRKRSFYINDLADDNGENWKQICNLIKVIENFYTDKNLHEIMLEAGNLIHAIPEYKFGDDDNIAISFRRLGTSNVSPESENRRMSIFNSRGVDDYINALDSNVSNLVQLGGFVEEYLVAKTESDNGLVSNESALFELQKPIIDLISFELVSAPQGETIYTSDLTDTIIPKEIYNTLQPYAGNQNIVTGGYKGSKLFFQLGEKSIQGLVFQAPHNDNNNLSRDYAIKHILNRALADPLDVNMGSGDPMTNTNYKRNLMINDFVFRIRYRTKDTIRNVQTRMDLRKYLLSSGVERFPLLLQTLQQNDKYVDSNKFGLNTFGKLIKSGNTTYQENEWCNNYDEIKLAGDLYRMHNELLYVSKNIYTVWADHLTNQLEYSKDFNKLSPIVGIPSEPRYYEISEQSNIRRDISIKDCILLGTAIDKESWDTGSDNIYKDFFLLTPEMTKWLEKVIFGGTELERAFPKYAITVFKNTPSSELSQGSWRKAFMHTMSIYSSMNSIVFAWEMVDNFSAGISVVDADVSNFPSDWVIDGLYQVSADRAYKALQYKKYCDSMGRSDLIDFAIIKDLNSPPTIENVRELPTISTTGAVISNEAIAPYIADIPKENYYVSLHPNVDNNKAQEMLDSNRGIILKKDNREHIGINYSINLLTDSDRFMISSILFNNNKSNTKIALFRDEINKMRDGYVDRDKIFLIDIGDAEIISTGQDNCSFGIKILDKVIAAGLSEQDKLNIKAIGIYNPDDQDDNSSMIRVIMGRNIGDLDTSTDTTEIDNTPQNERKQFAFTDWYISVASNDYFRKQ